MTPPRSSDHRPLATSETHPIRVDAVPVDGVPGRAGINFAPGVAPTRPRGRAAA